MSQDFIPPVELNRYSKLPSMEKVSEIVRPVIEFLAKNYHPHVVMIITNSSCELHEGLMRYNTDDFIE